MDFITVYDEFNQRWNVFEDDILYKEALNAVAAARSEGAVPSKIVWPIRYLTENRGWGWWTVWTAIDEIERSLEKIMPNPAKVALIEEREYTPTELQDLLQKLGGHMAMLHTLLGRNYSSAHALKEGYKSAIQVGMAQLDVKNITVTEKESGLLAGNELLRQTKRMQIQSESSVSFLKGWLDAYQIAWDTTSRIITLRLGETELATGRHL